MAHLQRSLATLRIAGDPLVPDEISSLLGTLPTKAQSKEQDLITYSATGIRIARAGFWRLNASNTEPANLDHQVHELLAKLTPDLAVWRDLSNRFDIDLFCGWFMDGSNEGISVSAATLMALGERGIKLSLDIYGPDTDTEI